jgi:hypothetical protein
MKPVVEAAVIYLIVGAVVTVVITAVVLSLQ